MAHADEKKWYSVTTNKQKKHAEINIYGVIGDWWDGVDLASFLDDIAPYKNYETITVYISSVGGTFADGLPIYNILKQHKATITTVNMGYALSMGSIIMLAGDHRHSAQNALQMLHLPNHFVYGSLDRKDHEHDIKVLDAHQSSILPRYREILGLSAEDVIAILEEETWYSADQALEAGLIEKIIDPVDLDKIEEKMQGDDWENAVKNLRFKPPQMFVNRVCKLIPNTKQTFAKLKPATKCASQQLSKEDDDDMTPEQLEELKASLKQEINDVVANQLDEKLAKLKVPNKQEIADVVKEKLEAKFDELLENKFTLSVSDQEKLNEIHAQLDGLKELPVNQRDSRFNTLPNSNNQTTEANYS